MEDQSQHHEGSHPTPAKYAGIALVLLLITIVEVWALYIEQLKSVLVPFLLVLSITKFIMVVMFYMHLKFDNRLFTWMFASCMTLAICIGLSLMALFSAF